MNTRIHYLYRDASNYKQGHEVVVAGEIRYNKIKDKLDDGVYFIASQVGLPDIQTKWREKGYPFPSEDDHVYCELRKDDLKFTDQNPTIDLTAEELRNNFLAVEEWDELSAMERLGIPVS